MGVYTVVLPEKVKIILNRLEQAGFEAYAVGGCVRDSILGRTPSDWDITTSARPQQVKQVFSRTVDTGIKHGTVTVLLGRDSFEVTTFRIDGEYSDGRHPDAVAFTSCLKEDVRRRDFTINAMAYSDRTGIVDYFGGIQDIRDRRIRAVGDPDRRFTEDALRIMRAVRFSAQLDYQIEPETLEAVRRHVPNLKKISAERIRVELEKLLLSDHPDRLRLLYSTGIADVILPEFSACMKTPQNNPHHCYTVGEHIIHAVEYVRKDRVLRLTMLLHDIMKPACRTTDEKGIDHFYGHVKRSADQAVIILRRLKYDNRTIHDVKILVENHDNSIAPDPYSVRKMIVRVGEDLFPLLLEVRDADISAQSDYHIEEKRENLAAVKEVYRGILARGDCLSLRTMAVHGGDLLKAGVRPGAGIGAILQLMFEDVLRDPQHNDRNYLLSRYHRRIARDAQVPYGKE